MFGVALAVVSIAFFCLAVQSDGASGVVWVGASLGLWWLSLFVLGWGFFGGFLLQIGLFFAMTLRNMVRN